MKSSPVCPSLWNGSHPSDPPYPRIKQDHKDEKNSHVFSGASAEKSKRFFQNRYSSLPIGAVSPESVTNGESEYFYRARFHVVIPEKMCGPCAHRVGRHEIALSIANATGCPLEIIFARKWDIHIRQGWEKRIRAGSSAGHAVASRSSGQSRQRGLQSPRAVLDLRSSG